MVTHEPDIARHCKRILTLRDGRMVEDEIQTERLDAKTEIARINAEDEARRSKTKSAALKAAEEQRA